MPDRFEMSDAGDPMDVQRDPNNQWPHAQVPAAAPLPEAKWLPAIDACRPASDDLALVELHELAAELATNPRLAQMHDRIQSLDAAIARATVDVPVPEGLQARLMASLAAAAVAAEVGETAAVLVSPGLVSPGLVTPASIASPESSRKTLPSGRWPTGRILAYGALAASVAAAAIYLSRPAPRTIGADEIMQLAVDFHEQADDAATQALEPGSELPIGSSGNANYPLSTAITAGGTTRMRTLSDFLGRSGVAYDMSRGRARATLYVVDLSASRDAPPVEPALPKAPSAAPEFDTGGHCVAVWQATGLLYVLVVDGGPREYQHFVPPAGRIARREASRPTWLAGNRAGTGRDLLFDKVSLI